MQSILFSSLIFQNITLWEPFIGNQELKKEGKKGEKKMKVEKRKKNKSIGLNEKTQLHWWSKELCI